MSDGEETTLADSVVDSMHSCASTLVGSAGGASGGDQDTDMEEEILSADEIELVRRVRSRGGDDDGGEREEKSHGRRRREKVKRLQQPAHCTTRSPSS